MGSQQQNCSILGQDNLSSLYEPGNSLVASPSYFTSTTDGAITYPKNDEGLVTNSSIQRGTTQKPVNEL
jgi:hypothetical protein